MSSEGNAGAAIAAERAEVVPTGLPGGVRTSTHPDRIRLSPGGSMLLDVVRFGAALVVLVHHWVDPRFTGGTWPSIGEAGHGAVCVFFVLSGFMIRFVTRSRVDTPQEYLIDRASRLYSVVLPALAFTLLAEMVVGAVNPVRWQSYRLQVPWSLVPLSLLQNIFFTQPSWAYGLPALSNAPFWSLGYEVFYYIAYGMLHYRVRWGWAAGLLLLVVGGPTVLLLAPIWWLGCWTCDLYLYWRRRPDGGVMLSGAALGGLLVLLAAFRHPLTAVLHATRIAERQAWLERMLSGWRGPDLHIAGEIPWLDAASPSYVILGLLTAVGMLFALLALDRWMLPVSKTVTRRVRYVAEGTFALYLLHVPLLELITGLLRHPVSSRAGGLALLVVALVVPVIAADPLNRLKDWMRRTMRGADGDVKA